MNPFRSGRPSPALLVAVIALVAALAGSAVALPGKSSVKSNDVAKNAIKGKHVKPDSLQGSDVKPDSLTGADIDEASLGTVPLAAAAENVAAIPLTRRTPTDGVNETPTRAAAPEVPLFTKGPITIYGKCFRHSGILVVGTYVKSSVNGVVYDSGGDVKSGGLAPGAYLNTTTPETDAEINEEDSVLSNGTTFDNYNDNDFSILTPDGLALRGLLMQGAKHGSVAYDGGFGAGDGCIWSGFVVG